MQSLSVPAAGNSGPLLLGSRLGDLLPSPAQLPPSPTHVGLRADVADPHACAVPVQSLSPSPRTVPASS